MRDLIEKIRHEFAATSKVRAACDQWHDLSDEYDRYPCHSPARRAVGEQIAECLGVIAAGLESAKLPRMFASFDPDELRTDMFGWINGDDMSGEGTCDHVR